MNFMQWLNSLDELLYEVVSWIIFFPLTLWKIVRHPFAMMDYAAAELAKDDDDQYAETLSPPIFLILALVISHAIGIAIGGGTNPIVRSHHGLAGLINDNTTFLLFKIVLFSTFPLLLATQMVRKTGKLDRNRLQPAFYAQCFAMAPFALAIGLGAAMDQLHASWAKPLGAPLAGIGILLYIAVQTGWFMRGLHQSAPRALGNALLAITAGLLIAAIIVYLFII
ncbi:MAG: hypothetical protein ABW169_11990 [Sphingobium sp.]